MKQKHPRTMVSPGGTPLPSQVFHTLFAPVDGVSGPDYHPEPIAKIFVTRFDTRGPVQALRPYRADELADNAAIFARFGGGTYELIARRDDGTIYAKRVITIEGDPKSMNGDPASPQNGAAAPAVALPNAPPPLPAASNASETMLHYMMQMNMQQMTMLGNVMVAMVGGNKGDAAEQARVMGETMRTTIEMMKATLPPQAPPQSGVSAAKEILDLAKALQPPPPAPPAPPTVKEETTSDIISALAGALGPFAQLAANGAQAAQAAQAISGPVGALMQG